MIGIWQCERCHYFLNSTELSECKRCGAARPPDKLREGLTEAEKQACEWFENLRDDIMRTPRQLTEDETLNVAIHLELCQTHKALFEGPANPILN